MRPEAHRERAARGLPAPADRACRARGTSVCHLVVSALLVGAGRRSEIEARGGRRAEEQNRRQTPNEEQCANAAADSPRTRGARTFHAGRPRASRSACVRAPSRGERPTRRREATERESDARGATGEMIETTPTPQQKVAGFRSVIPPSSPLSPPPPLLCQPSFLPCFLVFLRKVRHWLCPAPSMK